MHCYLCGYLCDYDDSGLCFECRELVRRNNERVMVLALLQDIMAEAGGYLKMATDRDMAEASGRGDVHASARGTVRATKRE